MRFKERAEVVIILLCDRIKLVIMAPCALKCQTQKCLTRLFNSLKHPDIAVELVPVASEKSCGAEDIRIRRSQFITCQHFDNHLVIRFVIIERFDNPVTPAPEMSLAVTDFVNASTSIPIAVTPDVHPVASPAFAILRASKQSVNDFLKSIGGLILQECVQFRACWRKPG